MSKSERSNLSGSSTPSGAPGSPTNKIKFLCSHGGKILPSPVDGNLKYVGGESRLISVPRDINLQELMKKLTYQIEEEMVLKYQLVLEELDSLVSVKSEDDLKHMFDEYDRYKSLGSPRLRVFLFPAKSVLIESSKSMDNHGNEQRYIDAINGITRGTKRLTAFGFSTNNSSSVCSSSPPSPMSYNIHPSPYQNQETSEISEMRKVHSSPNICNLDGQNRQHQPSPKKYTGFYVQSSSRSSIEGQHSQRQSSPYHGSPNRTSFEGQHSQRQSSPYHVSPNRTSFEGQWQSSPNRPQLSFQQHYVHDYRTLLYRTKPARDHSLTTLGPDKLMMSRSVGRSDGVKYVVDPVTQYYYPLTQSPDSRNGVLEN